MSKASNGPSRGLAAILETAAAPHGNDLEREMHELIAERQAFNEKRNGRIPTAEVEYRQPAPAKISEPLSDDARKLISKAIVMAAEQLAKEAKDAVVKYVEDAEALHAEVTAWAEALVRNANETASQVAERHAALLRSRPLFQQAMNGEPESLPNPLPPKPQDEPS